MKVILNKCYGGFGISKAGYELYAKKKGIDIFAYETDFVNGKSVYKKTCKGDMLFITYLTKDYGDCIEESSVDFAKFDLYLDSGHREDPILIEVVEELGDSANGSFAKLVIVDIPDGMKYEIDDYDGVETLHQKVKKW